ncbi:hypothetical protein KCU93_g5798, partial [Aureobasidium melanogenum]
MSDHRIEESSAMSEPVAPVVNSSKSSNKPNHELKQAFNSMIDHFENAEHDAAEALAYGLIQEERLPVRYRVFAHIVLAYGPNDRLYHACKAVEEAQWGIKDRGSEQGVGTELLEVAERSLQDVRHDAATALNSEDVDQEVQPADPSQPSLAGANKVENPGSPAQMSVVETREATTAPDPGPGPETASAQPPTVSAKIWKPDEVRQDIEEESYFESLVTEHERAEAENAKKRARDMAKEEVKKRERQAGVANNPALQQRGRSASIATETSSQRAARKREHSDGSQDEEQEPLKKQKGDADTEEIEEK